MTRATKAITIIILIGVAVLCFLYFYDFPKRVNLTKDAVIYAKDNPSTTMSTKINIDGTLYKPLFKQNTFDGNISIDAYEFTKSSNMIDIYITQRESGINMGTLLYYTITHSSHSANLNTLGTGMIWFDDDFQNINIRTASPEDWNQDRDKGVFWFIVTGNSYEEALKTQQVMREKFGEGFVPK